MDDKAHRDRLHVETAARVGEEVRKIVADVVSQLFDGIDKLVVERDAAQRDATAWSQMVSGLSRTEQDLRDHIEDLEQEQKTVFDTLGRSSFKLSMHPTDPRACHATIEVALPVEEAAKLRDALYRTRTP